MIFGVPSIGRVSRLVIVFLNLKNLAGNVHVHGLKASLYYAVLKRELPHHITNCCTIEIRNYKDLTF